MIYDGPMHGLPAGRLSDGTLVGAKPDLNLRQVADDYMLYQLGRRHVPPAEYVKADPVRGARIARAFEVMQHTPRLILVARCYLAFMFETRSQYQYLAQAGYTFEFYPADRDPYPLGPRQSLLDLQNNRHMYVWPTTSGFGMGSNDEKYPHNPLLLHALSLRWGGKPVTFNDLFRAVHDAFGHAAEGVGFRADGEENAWRIHSRMYTWPARRAMTTETRGQNSWVNFGPHGERNRQANQAETIYADQKVGLLPDWVVKEDA